MPNFNYFFTKNPNFTINVSRARLKISDAVFSSRFNATYGIVIGGNFTNYNGIVGRNNFIKFDTNGDVDEAFVANASDGGKFNSTINAIAIQSDGKILVGGGFGSYAGTAGRDRLIRLNDNGTLDTTFTTNSSDGNKFNTTVSAIAIQSDNKIVVGGNFTNYAGTAGRNRLIRLNDDGTLDTTFTTNSSDGNKFNGAINAIAIQSDGKILVGGIFNNYNTVAGRSALVRLNDNGTLDTTFTDNASNNAGINRFNSTINAIAFQSDGKILVGGAFTNYNGTANRNRLVRLNDDGTLDTTFTTNSSDGNKFGNTINSIAIQSDNKIVVGGLFTGYNGTTDRNRLVRLNNDGTLDTTFTTNASDGNKFNNVVRTVLVRSDNKIVVGGDFIDYNLANNRNRLITLNSDGTIDSPFCTLAVDSSALNNQIRALSISENNKILVSGDLTNYSNRDFINTDVSKNINRVVRFNSNGTLDSVFNANASEGGKFNGQIPSLIVQPDNKILVGGGFTNYNTVSGRSSLVRLNSDGTLDTTFTTNSSDGSKFNNAVNAIAVRSDNRILVGGNFTNYNATTNRNRLIMLDNTGVIDTTFTTNSSDGNKFGNTITTVAVQSDNKVLVGGNFIDYNSTVGRSRFVRLNANGTLDTAFTTNSSDGTKFNGQISTIAVQSDGRILVGGFFTNYNGTANRNRLVRLNNDGTLDTTFTTNASDGNKFGNTIISIAIQSDGKILVGGFFTNYAGTAGRSYLIRLNDDGTLDTTFNTINLFLNSVTNILPSGDNVFVGTITGASVFGTLVKLDNNVNYI